MLLLMSVFIQKLQCINNFKWTAFFCFFLIFIILGPYNCITTCVKSM